MASECSDEFMRDAATDPSDGGYAASVEEQTASPWPAARPPVQDQVKTPAAQPPGGDAASFCSDDVMQEDGDADMSDVVDFEFHQPSETKAESRAKPHCNFDKIDPVRLTALGHMIDPCKIARLARKWIGRVPCLFTNNASSGTAAKEMDDTYIPGQSKVAILRCCDL